MEHEDIVVFCHPNGNDYVALIGEQWRLPDKKVW